MGPCVYDKADWHQGDDWPDQLPETQAFVYTGVFLGWLIDHDLLSDSFRKQYERQVASFKNRQMTGPQVYEFCDGVLMDDMLNREGNAFTQFYYDFRQGESAYASDYLVLLATSLPSTYHVEDNWENYDRLKRHIDKVYSEWRATRAVDAALDMTPP